jgi:hypothetical protein
MSVANDRAQVHVRAADRARVYDQIDRAIAARWKRTTLGGVR